MFNKLDAFILGLIVMLFSAAISVYPANPNKCHSKAERRLVKSIIIAQPVNINKADEAELILLNGVGEKKAKAIIAYRHKHGAFKLTNEIKKVPGISKSVYSKIKAVITV